MNYSKSSQKPIENKDTQQPLNLVFGKWRLMASLSFLFFLLLLGCSEFFGGADTKGKDISPLPVMVFDEDEKKIVPYLDGSFTFAESEARKHALDIALSFEQTDGVARTIKDLRVINVPRTDTLDSNNRQYLKKDTTPELYIYNFSPKGFAIISADGRSMGHIASSMYATLNDRIDHPGYGIMLEGAVLSVWHDREQFEKRRDSVLRTATYQKLEDKFRALMTEEERQQYDGNRIGRQAYYTGGYGGTYSSCWGTQIVVETWYGYTGVNDRTTTKTDTLTLRLWGPLLRTAFSQDAPYNNYFPLGNCNNTINQRHLAGCVPIAYSQICLYFNVNPFAQDLFSNNQAFASRFQKLRDYHYNSTYNNWLKAYGSYGEYDLDDAAATLARNVYNRFLFKDSDCGSTGIWDDIQGNIITP